MSASEVDDQPSTGFVNTYAAPRWGLSPYPAAPTTTVSPLMATDAPNMSPVHPSGAVSLIGSETEAHPSGGLLYRYAAPAPACCGMPTTSVSSEITTDHPKKEVSAVSGAVNSMASEVDCQAPLPGFSNRYSEPGSFSRIAPTATVSEPTDTEYPKNLSASPRGDVSLAAFEVDSQPSSGLAKMYAAPVPRETPGAPIAIVSEVSATDQPKFPSSPPGG